MEIKRQAAVQVTAAFFMGDKQEDNTVERAGPNPEDFQPSWLVGRSPYLHHRR